MAFSQSAVLDNSENSIATFPELDDYIKILSEKNGISSLRDSAIKRTADHIKLRVLVLIKHASQIMELEERSKLLHCDLSYALLLHYRKSKIGAIVDSTLSTTCTEPSPAQVFLYWSKIKNIKTDNAINIAKPLAYMDFEETDLEMQDIAEEGLSKQVLNMSELMESQESLISQFNDETSEEDSSEPENLAELLQESTEIPAYLKLIKPYKISKERQNYLNNIIMACASNNGHSHKLVLNTLRFDSEINEFMPTICAFLSSNFDLNVEQRNLDFLMFTMRMINALLNNESLYIISYLHIFIPMVTTCILCYNLYIRKDFQKHWALRDYAARVLGKIYHTFDNTDNDGVQKRIICVLHKCLMQDDMHLNSVYGAIAAIAQLGHEPVNEYIVPKIKSISELIKKHITYNSDAIYKTAAQKIRLLLIRVCATALIEVANPPHNLEMYIETFGNIGNALYYSVENLKQLNKAATMDELTDEYSEPATHAQATVYSVSNCKRFA